MNIFKTLLRFYRADFNEKTNWQNDKAAEKTFVGGIVDSRIFHDLVIVVILCSALLVGLETNRELVAEYHTLLYGFDQAILTFFVLELVLRILADMAKTGEDGRKIWYRFFLDSWHIFDFIIVFICLLPLHATFFAVLRTARILRVLLLIDKLPRLKLLVRALLKSFPSMGYVSLLLLLHFYAYAIIGIDIFGEHDPVKFGNLGAAMLSLFQIVTGDDWTSIMGHALESTVGFERFGVAAYFVSFIIIGAMIFMNLFIGVITSEIADLKAQDDKKKLLAQYAKENDTLGFAVEQVEIQMREMQEALAALKIAVSSSETAKKNWRKGG